MDREKVVKDNAIRGLQSAIEISGALVHLRKEHAEAILELIKELEGYKEIVFSLLDIGYPHNFQREEPWIRDYCYKITGVVKMAYDAVEEEGK